MKHAQHTLVIRFDNIGTPCGYIDAWCGDISTQHPVNGELCSALAVTGATCSMIHSAWLQQHSIPFCTELGGVISGFGVNNHLNIVGTVELALILSILELVSQVS